LSSPLRVSLAKGTESQIHVSPSLGKGH
jgi:hypothetical protein